MKTAKKIIAVVICLSMVFTPDSAAMSGVGIEIVPIRETTSFFQIDIPAELASLDEFYEAPARQDSKIILHIQNAHANYGAQDKIKLLLQHLGLKYGFKTIFLEGASDDLHPEYLKFFPDDARNRKLARFLMEQGELTGAEMYLLEARSQVSEPGSTKRKQGLEAQGRAPRAHGIERADLYRQNYEALKIVFGAEETAKRYLQGFEARLDKLASGVFSSELRKMLVEWKKFEKGHREFMPYVQRLAKESKRVLDIDLESLFAQVEWPQMTRLLMLQTLEKEINVQRADTEKEALLKFLKGKRVSEALLQEIENFQDQKVTVMGRAPDGKPAQIEPRDLIERLAREARPKGFQFSDYPYFSVQAGYLILKAELDPKSLFEEIRLLFTRLLDKLANGETEKSLLDLYRDEELVRKLMSLELTRKDWEEAQQKKAQIEPYALVARLNKLTQTEDAGPGSGKENTRPPSKSEAFRQEVVKIHNAALDFYVAARQRENVFYEKIDAKLRESGDTKAVLITGGFHTNGVTELLREHHISYGVLTPRLSERSDEQLYRTIMLQNRSSTFELSYLENTLLTLVPKAQWDQLGKEGVRERVKVFIQALMAQDLGRIDAFGLFNQSELAAALGVNVSLQPRLAVVNGKLVYTLKINEKEVSVPFATTEQYRKALGSIAKDAQDENLANEALIREMADSMNKAGEAAARAGFNQGEPDVNAMVESLTEEMQKQGQQVTKQQVARALLQNLRPENRETPTTDARQEKRSESRKFEVARINEKPRQESRAEEQAVKLGGFTFATTMKINEADLLAQMAELPRQRHKGLRLKEDGSFELTSWRVFETPLDQVARDFNQVEIDFIKDVIRRATQAKQKGKTITIVDWGCGNARALMDLAAVLESAGLRDAVVLIGFADMIAPEWKEASGFGIKMILDSSNNFQKYFDTGSIEILFSYSALHHLGNQEFYGSYVNYLKSLRPLLSNEGYLIHNKFGNRIMSPDYSEKDRSEILSDLSQVYNVEHKKDVLLLTPHLEIGATPSASPDAAPASAETRRSEARDTPSRSENRNEVVLRQEFKEKVAVVMNNSQYVLSGNVVGDSFEKINLKKAYPMGSLWLAPRIDQKLDAMLVEGDVGGATTYLIVLTDQQGVVKYMGIQPTDISTVGSMPKEEGLFEIVHPQYYPAMSTKLKGVKAASDHMDLAYEARFRSPNQRQQMKDLEYGVQLVMDPILPGMTEDFFENLFVSNPLFREIVRNVGPQTFKRLFGEAYLMLHPKDSKVGGISATGSGVFFSLEYLTPYMSKTQIITHEFAHEAYRGLTVEKSARLQSCFMGRGKKLIEAIHKHPLYKEKPEKALVTECIAYIVGNLSVGQDWYGSDKDGTFYAFTPDDIDILINTGFMPESLKPTVQERERMKGLVRMFQDTEYRDRFFKELNAYRRTIARTKTNVISQEPGSDKGEPGSAPGGIARSDVRAETRDTPSRDRFEMQITEDGSTHKTLLRIAAGALTAVLTTFTALNFPVFFAGFAIVAGSSVAGIWLGRTLRRLRSPGLAFQDQVFQLPGAPTQKPLLENALATADAVDWNNVDANVKSIIKALGGVLQFNITDYKKDFWFKKFQKLRLEAHGCRSGLENFLKILLSGVVKPGRNGFVDWGRFFPGKSESIAGATPSLESFGPYYVVLYAKWIGPDEALDGLLAYLHSAYVVPNDATKEYILRFLEKAVEMDYLDREKASALTAKILTYEEAARTPLMTYAVPARAETRDTPLRSEAPEGYNRARVPADKIPWEVAYSDYRPNHFEGPMLSRHAYNDQNPVDWADKADFLEVLADIAAGKREPLESHAGEIRYDPTTGLPLNPNGRTGTSGRGILGKYGPNQAADIVLTLWNPDMKRIEIIVGKRADNGLWTSPGGFVDKIVRGDRVVLEHKLGSPETYANMDAGRQRDGTAVAEIAEETGIRLTESEISSAEVLYQGFVDDPRNTDNAWVETTAFHVHVSDPVRVREILRTARVVDPLEIVEIRNVRIDEINPEEMHASHGDFLKQINERATALTLLSSASSGAELNTAEVQGSGQAQKTPPTEASVTEAAKKDHGMLWGVAGYVTILVFLNPAILIGIFWKLVFPRMEALSPEVVIGIVSSPLVLLVIGVFSAAGSFLPSFFEKRKTQKEYQAIAEDGFARLRDAAQGDRVLSGEWATGRYAVKVVMDSKDAYYDGKDRAIDADGRESRIIKVAPKYMRPQDVFKYTVVRRTLGFRYQDLADRIEDAIGSSSLLSGLLYPVWMVHSTYETLKRVRFYKNPFVVLYVIMYGMISTSVAMFAIPFTIVYEMATRPLKTSVALYRIIRYFWSGQRAFVESRISPESARLPRFPGLYSLMQGGGWVFISLTMLNLILEIFQKGATVPQWSIWVVRALSMTLGYIASLRVFLKEIKTHEARRGRLETLDPTPKESVAKRAEVRSRAETRGAPVQMGLFDIPNARDVLRQAQEMNKVPGGLLHNSLAKIARAYDYPEPDAAAFKAIEKLVTLTTGSFVRAGFKVQGITQKEDDYLTAEDVADRILRGEVLYVEDEPTDDEKRFGEPVGGYFESRSEVRPPAGQVKGVKKADAVVTAIPTALIADLDRIRTNPAKFLARHFNADRLADKLLALYNVQRAPDQAEPIREYVLAAAKTAADEMEKGERGQAAVLMISGEASAAYEKIVNRGGVLRNLAGSDGEKFNPLVYNGGKELDITTFNTVIEAKFHLKYSDFVQVLGGSSGRLSHLQAMHLDTTEALEGIRNIVLFGENEGDIVGRIVTAFLGISDPRIFRELVVTDKGFSLKLRLGDMPRFLFSDQVLRVIEREYGKQARAQWERMKNRMDRGIRDVLSTLKKGEHFDFIVAVSNGDPRDVAALKRIAGRAESRAEIRSEEALNAMDDALDLATALAAREGAGEFDARKFWESLGTAEQNALRRSMKEIRESGRGATLSEPVFAVAILVGGILRQTEKAVASRQLLELAVALGSKATGSLSDAFKELFPDRTLPVSEATGFVIDAVPGMPSAKKLDAIKVMLALNPNQRYFLLVGRERVLEVRAQMEEWAAANHIENMEARFKVQALPVRNKESMINTLFNSAKTGEVVVLSDSVLDLYLLNNKARWIHRSGEIPADLDDICTVKAVEFSQNIKTDDGSIQGKGRQFEFNLKGLQAVAARLNAEIQGLFSLAASA